MKYAITIFIYLSLGFVIYRLATADYLVIPQIYSYPHFVISITSLFAGFFLQVVSWQLTLAAFDIRVRYSEALASVGMTIFTKYIPGKVWMIAGRAAYLAERTEYGFKKMTFVSTYAQLLSIWTGLSLSLFIFHDTEKLGLWWAVVLLPWAGISVVLFCKWLYRGGELTLSFLIQRTVSLPTLDFRMVLRIIPCFVFTWLFWSLGFGMLTVSLVEEPMSIGASLAFPLAATIGMLAYVAPGGLGVREGVLVVYLESMGISLAHATTIALFARLWFLVGEFFIFLMAFLSRKYLRKPDYE
ncbi:MAG: lysylphosphatidylglycerol synthase domain-containing protein [Gammaproteobacteria bacterium]|nr:lysylphosphatidylglycerol synthase domain-containing protein [Gammaproteobacteria bacterium]